MRPSTGFLLAVVVAAACLTAASATEDPAYCTRCHTTSEGPCQNSDTGVCYNYIDMVAGLCAPGTKECVCPPCTSGVGQPCHLESNPHQCAPYVNPAMRVCADDMFECGAMGVVTSPSSSPSPGSPPSASSTPHPVVDTTPPCGPCAGDSSGPCLGLDNACFDYIPLTNECPPGSYPCVCPTCPAGSAGPCQSLADGTCTGYADPASSTCPLHHFECGHPPVLPSPVPPATPSSSPGPAGTCSACFGASQGPCQSDYGVCHELNGEGQCPPGSRECNCPVCPAGTAGRPCFNIESEECVDYADPIMRMCPEHAFECGEPSVRISPSSSPSPGSDPTPTPSISASFDPNPPCQPCIGESQGFCQDVHSVCYESADGLSCPGGTKKCTCPTCVFGAGEPCHDVDNPEVCVGYDSFNDDDGVGSCPSGTFECFKPAGTSIGGGGPSPGPAPVCRPCFGTSAGECQAADGVCSDIVDNACAAGTRQCACPSCLSGSGACRNSDGECQPAVSDMFGNTVCANLGFFICGAPSVYLDPSSSPSPGSLPTPSPTPFPQDGVTPECRACAGLSEGPCQSYSGTCYARPFSGASCPPGTYDCDCPVCAVGSGPCHATDGSRSCVDHVDDNGFCPEGFFECGQPVAGPSPTPSVVGPPATCLPCFGASEGPCQAADTTCHYKYALPGGEEGSCPPGTNECECPTCVNGAAPCVRSDGFCFDYADAGARECPAGTFECGQPSVFLSPTPSPSFGSTRSPSASPNPSNRPIPFCRPCAPLTSGACQDANTVCWDMGANGLCPPHTFECECQTCTSGDGPCRSARLDGSCRPFDDASERVCPVGYFECGLNLPSPTPSPGASLGPVPTCTACVGQSRGDCQSEYGVCFDKIQGMCPTGTRECSCPACVGSFGPCHRADGVCVDYFDLLTFECPDGTFECGEPSIRVSPSPSPSFGAPPSTTPTATPSPDLHPRCQACVPISEGMCVDSHGVCHDYLMDTTTCPHATRECDCEPCTSGSGPCHGLGDDYYTCVPYANAAEQECPAGTFECGGYDPAAGAGGLTGPAPTPLPPQECVPCFGSSSGPCQIPDIGVCFELGANGQCPSGTQECICPACAGGTFGDCHRFHDGMCVNPTTVNGQCPHGTFRCGDPAVAISPSPSPTPGLPPSATPSPSPSFDPNPECKACYGASSGACQQDNTVCSDFFVGTTTCPPGTKECTCPTCQLGTSGPCHDEASGACLAYADAALRICPVDSFECGEPSIRVEEPTGPAICGPCFQHSWGPCQRGDGLCFLQEDNGDCPASSTLCECPACHSGSGPCRGAGNTCSEYTPGTSSCPAFTFECGVGTTKPPTQDPELALSSSTDSGILQVEDACAQCVVGTSGPCMSENNICYQYYAATTLCPAGTVKCRSYDVTAPAYDPRCTSCHTGGPSTGFCQGSDMVCWNTIPGTTLCPTGTSLCGVDNVEEESPVVPVTVPVNGEAASVTDGSGEAYTVSSTSESNDECVAAWSEPNPCSDSATDSSSACLPVVVSIDGTCGDEAAAAVSGRRLDDGLTDVVIQVSDRMAAVLPEAYELTLRTRGDGGDGSRRLSDGECTSVYHASSRSVYARCPDGQYVLSVSERSGADLEAVPEVAVGPASTRAEVEDGAPSDAGEVEVVVGGSEGGDESDESGGKSVSAGAVAVTAIVVGCVTFLGAYLVRRQVYASRNASAQKPGKNQIAPEATTPGGCGSSASETTEEAEHDPVAAMMAAEADAGGKDDATRPSATVEVVTE